MNKLKCKNLEFCDSKTEDGLCTLPKGSCSYQRELTTREIITEGKRVLVEAEALLER